MNYEIDITRRCNFSCPGCNHLCNIASDASSDMTPEDIRSVIDQINANDLNPQRVIVVGGEPTLHPRCAEYCRYIKEHVRGFSQLRVNTNFSNPGVLAEIEALGYDAADYLGPRDPAEQRRIKASVHYNSLISPKEEGIPINDPRTCFVLRGLDGSGPCGICVHRYKGRLVWCYCPNATSIAKLLRREDEFLFPTLADLLRSDKYGLCGEICVHCMSIAKRQVLAKDTPGKVSACFRAGLDEFRRYGGGPAESASAVPAASDAAPSLAGLVGFLAGGGGRTDMSAVVLGGSREDVFSILSTGTVATVYHVGDDAGCDDRRVVHVPPGLAGAVAGGAVPRDVDMLLIPGGDLYPGAAADIGAALGMCDAAAGLAPWTSGAGVVVRGVVGRPPDMLFPDGSWAVSSGGWRPSRSLRDAVADRFDRVMCLTCPQSMASRFGEFLSAMSAYGIGDMVLPYLNEHNVFAHAEVDRRRFANDGARKTNVKNCLMGHYGMVKFALDAGFGRVLFLEDDCRFAVSEPEAARYIRAMPDGACAAVDYIGVKEPVRSGLFGGPEQLWAVLPRGTFFDNLTCYMLDRDGMQCVVDYFERCGTPGYKWPVDAADRVWPHLTSSMPVYIPRARFAVQNGGKSLINGKEV